MTPATYIHARRMSVRCSAVPIAPEAWHVVYTGKYETCRTVCPGLTAVLRLVCRRLQFYQSSSDANLVNESVHLEGPS